MPDRPLSSPDAPYEFPDYRAARGKQGQWQFVRYSWQTAPDYCEVFVWDELFTRTCGHREEARFEMPVTCVTIQDFKGHHRDVRLGAQERAAALIAQATEPQECRRCRERNKEPAQQS